jgi:hypothetical protein
MVMKYTTDPASLILTILEYTGGQYTPKQVVEIYNVIQKLEEAPTKQASLAVLKERKAT